MSDDIHKARYISLATFRRNGNAVRTPVWFASCGAFAKIRSRRIFVRSLRCAKTSDAHVRACTLGFGVLRRPNDCVHAVVRFGFFARLDIEQKSSFMNARRAL